MKNDTRLQDHHDNAPPTSNKSGNMAGFDAEFTDIVDYILRITYRIWEGKQVGLCYDYYAADCPVYTLAGVSCSVETVVQNTLDTLAAFPDRTLHADNIIWGGNDREGFHSSHRIRTAMTNSGDSHFGAATNRHAVIPVIAHCIVKQNKVIEEWLVRDNYSLVQQLGFDPHTVARNQAQTPPDEHFSQWYDSELKRLAEVDSDRTALVKIATDAADTFIRKALHNIWNAKMLGDIQLAYDKNAKLHAPSGREATGHNEITQYYLQFLGTLSDLRVSVDYLCHQPSANGRIDIAARWTLAGKHTGTRLYGAPTGAKVLILGESHYRTNNGMIEEEWTVFDELSVLTHIYRARAQTENQD